MKKIQRALISVFHKEGLEPIVKKLNELGVEIFSTGGTLAFIESLDVPVQSVEGLTSYPSILGGRVKTLHPKVFGGILARTSNNSDIAELEEYDIPSFDLVIVDLYPFEETVASGASESEIIEKIDIGGISLIRAAAKNFNDTLIIASRNQYQDFLDTITTQEGATSIEQRKKHAALAFMISSHYDTHIYNYFTEGDEALAFKASLMEVKALRYGENPHQSAQFYGPINDYFDQLNGKELSYNNLVDVDAAVHLIREFDEPTFVIIKHTNACGIATRENIHDAYEAALACDNVSAFGGILITNGTVDQALAEQVHSLFFEVLIAPEFTEGALTLLKEKKKRILLKQKKFEATDQQFKSLLNGVLVQSFDNTVEDPSSAKVVTKNNPTSEELSDLHFALKSAKHLKSNTIALVKNKQLIGMGCGQTSRVDALRQAIAKAKSFGFDLKGAVMASDAFFPFPDCVEIAAGEGITSIVQPGGSIKDQLSIDACNNYEISMICTGVRHFKH